MITTLHKSNHNSLNIIKYPAHIHISLKVSTMSFFFLWLVCLNEDPHMIHMLHLVGGVHLRSPLNNVKWYKHGLLYLKEK